MLHINTSHMSYWYLNYKSAIGKTIAPQRCSCPNTQNLWICNLTWQKCLLVLKGIWNLASILDYPGGSNVIRRVFIKYRHEGQNQREIESEKGGGMGERERVKESEMLSFGFEDEWGDWELSNAISI